MTSRAPRWLTPGALALTLMLGGLAGAAPAAQAQQIVVVCPYAHFYWHGTCRPYSWAWDSFRQHDVDVSGLSW